jgi:copper chaperone CopZ
LARALGQIKLEDWSMATMKLRIDRMTCDHCVAKVEQALRRTRGVYSAIVDLHDGAAEVDFDDDSVTLDVLLDAVVRAGYPAKLVG